MTVDQLTAVLDGEKRDLLHLFLTEPQAVRKLLGSDRYQFSPDVRDYLDSCQPPDGGSYLQRRIRCLSDFEKFRRNRKNQEILKQKKEAIEALKRRWRRGMEPVPMVRDLTAPLSPGLFVDILDLFLLDRKEYQKLLQYRRLSPDIAEFLSLRHNISSKYYEERRAAYANQGSQYLLQKEVARAIEALFRTGNPETPREIRTLTEPVLSGMNLDLLDLFLLDRRLYQQFRKSPFVHLAPDLESFLKKHSAGKLQPKGYYQMQYRRYQEILSGQAPAGSLPITHLSDVVETENQSFLRLFLTDPAAFQRVCATPAYEIAPALLSFLNSYRPRIKGYSKKQEAEYLQAFEEDQQQREQEQKEEAFTLLLRELREATRTGQLHWKERRWRTAGHTREQTLVARWQGHEYVLSIFGRRLRPQIWKLRFSWETDGSARGTGAHTALLEQLYQETLQNVKGQKSAGISAGSQQQEEQEIPLHVLTPQDFVVRTNLFRCRSRRHHIQEIRALIPVLKPDGSQETEEAAAAYCPQCGCYFLMRWEYERISQKGTFLCPVVEKEVFHRQGLPLPRAAGESLLMQNGYTVKASVGLTDEQRQTILAHLMDNQILSASQILSYLQMFQAQRRGMPAYREAVAKWEADLQFTRRYQKNPGQKVFVHSITKTDYRSPSSV